MDKDKDKDNRISYFELYIGRTKINIGPKINKRIIYKNWFHRIFHEYIIHPNSLFMYGFLYQLSHIADDKDIVKNPLSRLFAHSIHAIFTGIGALLVSGFLPEGLRVLIPAILLTARTYQHINKEE